MTVGGEGSALLLAQARKNLPHVRGASNERGLQAIQPIRFDSPLGRKLEQLDDRQFLVTAQGDLPAHAVTWNGGLSP